MDVFATALSTATGARHRRFGAVILALAALASGCASSATTTTGPAPTKCQVALSTPTPVVDPSGGSGTLSVTTAQECVWTVTADQAWITVMSGTSGQGSATVDLRISPNPDTVSRRGAVTVNGERVEIEQGAAPCRFAVSPPDQTIGGAGGPGSVAVSATGSCSWNATSSAAWITITGGGGSGDGTVSYQVAANSGPSRTGTITIAGTTVSVTQLSAGAIAPPSCTYTIQVATQTVPAGGGQGSLVVTTGGSCAWTATTSAAWITSLTPSGSGNGTVSFTVGSNPGAARSGTITIAGQAFTISQASIPCTYAINPASQSVASTGSGGSVAVTAGPSCGWTATSSASWITGITPNGTGNGTVNFTVAANTGTARSGTITIAGQTFTISQAASPCAYTINPTSQSVASGGSSGSVAVTAGSSCAWTATSGAAWITGVTASGTGNGTVNFTVAANSGTARSGTITIAGQTFTINQGAVSCTYAINPASQSIAAGGGNGSVAVTAGSSCAWTATSGAAWITGVTPSGTANGTVNFTVAANTGAARNGTITIEGQTFTVNQAAVSCTYAINPISQSIATGGGSGSVAVTAGSSCAWTATSGAAWITGVTPSGTGNRTVNFTVAANGGAARSGTITIAGQTFTINQAATPCTYAINPVSQSLGSGGSNGSVAVTAGPSCAWTATSNAAWITGVTPSGTGNGTVNFVAAANPGSARTGTVTIAGQTFTATQASGCSFSLVPASAQTVSSNAGSYNVTITASNQSCDWTASVQSDSPWLTLTGPASGTGNGKVTFKVTKNNSSFRFGQLLIAERPFVVNQLTN